MPGEVVRVDMPIPRELHSEMQPVLSVLRSRLGIRRRTDAGISTVALVLLRVYLRDPDLRRTVAEEVRELVRDRAADAPAEFRAKLYGQLR